MTDAVTCKLFSPLDTFSSSDSESAPTGPSTESTSSTVADRTHGDVDQLNVPQCLAVDNLRCRMPSPTRLYSIICSLRELRLHTRANGFIKMIFSKPVTTYFCLTGGSSGSSYVYITPTYTHSFSDPSFVLTPSLRRAFNSAFLPSSTSVIDYDWEHSELPMSVSSVSLWPARSTNGGRQSGS